MLDLSFLNYENSLFFEDQPAEVMQDDVFAQLLTFPNVF